MKTPMASSSGRAWLLVAAVALASGCSSTPDRSDELERARAVVGAVESSPDAGKYAAGEITAAHDALRKAEQLAEDGKSAKQVRDAAYLAQRHAEVAGQQIARGQAEAETQRAEAERQRVIAQAREQEAAARVSEAAQRESAANAARVQAEQEAAQARSNAKDLQEQLRELQAKETDRGLVLTLGDVLFDIGQATLRPAAAASIDRLAQFLAQAPDRGVLIEGHTDSIGDEAFNQQLSESRASAVKAALVSRGIDQSRVTAVGLGESAPLASNDNAAGRQQNRRVEIVVSDPRVAATP